MCVNMQAHASSVSMVMSDTSYSIGYPVWSRNQKNAPMSKLN